MLIETPTSIDGYKSIPLRLWFWLQNVFPQEKFYMVMTRQDGVLSELMYLFSAKREASAQEFFKASYVITWEGMGGWCIDWSPIYKN